MLAAVILAAGASERMGFPKALLDYHGKTFLERWLELTRHPRIGLQRVVLGAHATEIRHRVPLPAEQVILNRRWRQGQLASIRAALVHLRAYETEGMLLAPVDHPAVKPATIAALLAAFDRHPQAIVIPVWKGRRGHPVIFSCRFYSDLYAAPDEIGARAVVRHYAQEVVEIATADQGVVLNIDDPETYMRWLHSSR